MLTGSSPQGGGPAAVERQRWIRTIKAKHFNAPVELTLVKRTFARGIRSSFKFISSRSLMLAILQLAMGNAHLMQKTFDNFLYMMVDISNHKTIRLFVKDSENVQARMVPSEVCATLLARGLVTAHDQASSTGSVLQQDAWMPAVLRQGLAHLSRLCVEAGIPDLGACVHTVSDLACLPMGAWGVPALASPFTYADAVLLERDAGVPTGDCREMSLIGGGEISAQEHVFHEALRDAVSKRPPKEKDGAYEAIRSFLVRNPAVAWDNLFAFIIKGGHTGALGVVQSFYRPVPQTALFGSIARRCGHCGSLLWPDRDLASFPKGRCRIRQCRLAHPEPAQGDLIADPSSWRVVTPAVMAYWVGPGLDEVRIYDALKAEGRDVRLYPQQDAADVSVDGLRVGVDVKAYASPVVLAARLTRDTGRLGIFKRRILAVPDDRLRTNRDYLLQLEQAYGGGLQIEFMTVSAAIRSLLR